MPILGGMEATELIRAYETHNDLTPTPIIALGAHGSAYSFRAEVVPGLLTFRGNPFSAIDDREHCLNAGMVRHALLSLSLWG